MTTRLIVAVDQGNSIGWSSGFLPWKLSTDMARFKQLTTGGTVVMGFNTFASLGRFNGLPDRRNIVLTRKDIIDARKLMGDGIEIISSLEWVERSAKGELRIGDQLRDYWLIGGASVYKEALDRKMVDEIHLTLVDGASRADVHFPYDISAWKLFVIRQRAHLGIEWEVADIIYDLQLPDQPHTTYLKLVKQ